MEGFHVFLPQPGNSSNHSCARGETQQVFLSVLLCLVFFLGFLLNAFSLWVFCFRMSSWTSGTTLQFHLALSDAIATPVMPLMAVYLAMGNVWPFGGFLCQVKIGLLCSHFYGSTIFLTLISIHRYDAVVHYKKNSYMKQKPFVRKLCVGVWCLLLILATAFAFMLPKGKEGNSSRCLSIHQGNLTNIYFVINHLLVTVGFLLPFMVSCFCYARLVGALTRLNISTANGLKVKVKSQRMVGMCLLIFGLCYLPLNVMRTAGVVLKKYYPDDCLGLLHVERAYYASLFLAGVNSCLDPLLYCFGSQNFRDAFGSLRIRQGDHHSRSDSEMITNQ